MTAARARRKDHRGQRSRKPLVIGALVVLLAAAVPVAILLRPPPPDHEPASADDASCPETPVEVLVAPDLAEPLAAGLAETGCTTVSAAADDDLADDAVQVVSALASTPVVLTGVDEAPANWRDALDLDGMALADPATDPATAAALAAALADVDRAELAAVVVPLAQSDGSADGPEVTTEQAALAGGVAAVVPADGTPLLSSPAHVAPGIDADLDGLAELLGSAEVADALVAAGFRVGERGPDGGVGEVAAVEVPEESVVEAVAAWSALSVPTRALAVIDVSGSMAFSAGESTRMELTVAATLGGLDLFPDSAAIGLWSFSHRVGGNNDGEDRAELIDVRPLGEGEQRAELRTALEGLPSRIGGATALYATALAAYQSALNDYDPNAVNSVLLFTDGSNDDPYSISQDQVVAQLEELRDPDRPVRIIAIGISADADGDALERIAAATGGDSFVAERPEDIAEVFAQALGSRAD